MVKAETGPGQKQAQRASLQKHRNSRSDLTRTLERSSTESQYAGPGTPTSPHSPDYPGATLQATFTCRTAFATPLTCSRWKGESRAPRKPPHPPGNFSPFPTSIPPELPPPQGLPEGESAPRAWGCCGSGWYSQSCPAAGMSMVMVLHVGHTRGRKGSGDGPKEAERHPNPRATPGHGAPQPLCCKRPRSQFQLPVLQARPPKAGDEEAGSTLEKTI